jgi:hypothetical protein
MSADLLVALIAGAALAGFIVYAFRQGEKVTPDDREDRGPSVGGGGDYT